jgi:DNA-binding MarR family transcriptional regulator
MHTTTATASSLAVPRGLESPRAKLVYVYLEREREASVDSLADALDLKKIDLLTVLSTLESAGVVERDGVTTVHAAD